MKQIKLTQGKVALVDNEDFEYLNQWKWFFDGKYAGRREKTGEKEIFMHRFINNTPQGFLTDHINRNKLDNRRINLRTVTYQQNQFNRNLSKNSSSGYMGVNWDKFNNKWLSRIKINDKLLNLGRFSDIKDAIKTREKAEKIYFGEFRRGALPSTL